MRNTGLIPAKPLPSPSIGTELSAHILNHLESELNSAVLEQNMDSKYFGWDVGEVARRRFNRFASSIKKKPVVKPMFAPQVQEANDPEPVAFPENRFELKERNMSGGSNITGARGLAGAFRDRLSAAKARIVEAHENMGSAMDNLERTAAQADSLVKEVEREAADLAAALGTFSNGGEPLDD